MSNKPSNVVILHQFPRGFRAPSASPFALKLETWLRLAEIEYKNEFTVTGRSAKGKVPWITHNGVDVSDSQFCIEYLAGKMNKNLSSHLTVLEKALARSFLKMTEESLVWALAIHRFKYGKAEDTGIPYLVFKYFGWSLSKRADAQGYGKHSKEEIYQIGKADLEALNNLIGSNTYLMGDKVCNEDASIFAILCQILHHDRGPLNKYLMNDCPNLMRYTENIKKLFWADWNENITDK